jgi:L-amino acid N-acyltransferase YncA
MRGVRARAARERTCSCGRCAVIPDTQQKTPQKRLCDFQKRIRSRYVVKITVMGSETATIRAAESTDSAAIAAIYNHYVAETVITFEEEPINDDEMARRIEDVRSASLPWLVAEENGQVAGYAYAAPWKARSAYRYSVEITVYLDPSNVGRGIGSMLYSHLFSLLQTLGIHAVIGGIALPNRASVALHEKLGCEKVAHFQQVGFKFNQWIDVGYWERIL